MVINILNWIGKAHNFKWCLNAQKSKTVQLPKLQRTEFHIG